MSEDVKPKVAPKTKLTDKQKLFCEFYLGAAKCNASEAARLAGYVDPGQAGYENKKKQEIQDYIAGRLDAKAMGADEVLSRMGDQGRATQDYFWEENEDGERWINLNSDKAKENFHLIKKIKMKRRVYKERDPDDPETVRPVTETEVEIEVHDSQAALVHMGRHHKLWTDKTEVSGELSVGVVRVPLKAGEDEWKQQSQEIKK